MDEKDIKKLAEEAKEAGYDLPEETSVKADTFLNVEPIEVIEYGNR